MADERERVDLEEIRAIIRLATEAEITELVVETPHIKVKVKKGDGGALDVAAHDVPHAAREHASSGATAPLGHTAHAAPDDAVARYVPVVAPMVGTFYRAAKPDAPPFVSEGDVVHAGQTLCVLEAMKLFNEIPSEIAGRIVRVLAENGAPVEYGQPLFLVDPSAA